jgi:formylglycine-generating enzyme required for sulfatase activity
MANVDDRFCVDRWEASVVERGADGEHGHAGNAPLEEGKTYVAKSAAGVAPQAYVSAAQGEAACHVAGKRLCQPVEWRAACAGAEGYAWSYGPAHEPGRCNDRGKNPIVLLHPPGGPRWPGWSMDDLNDPHLLELEGTVAKTGALATCANDLGVHDMVGNLHEWTADPNGTFQGGYFLDTTVNGEGCAYRTTAHHFRYHDYSTGFRCCSD